MKRNNPQVLVLTLCMILLISASFCLAGCQLRRNESPANPEITLYIPPSDEPRHTEAPEAASPTPGAKPSSKPEDGTSPSAAPAAATDTPESSAPEATPDPARYIHIATSEVIKITKHPRSETVRVGVGMSFIAHAENAVSREWRLVSPEFDREVLWNADNLQEEFPFLRCEGGDTDTLVLYSIPKQLNGWYAVCLFTDQDGGMLASDGARILVIGAGTAQKPTATDTPGTEPTTEPTTAPTGEPTAEPTGEPTAEPTGEPTPQPSEETVVEPVPLPSAAPAPEPETGE